MTRGAIRVLLAVAFAAFAVLCVPVRARAQAGGATLDSAPLHVFADGLGGIQVHADGVTGGLFYDSEDDPGHAGLEIKEGDRYYPLETPDFQFNIGRVSVAPIIITDQGGGTKVMQSIYTIGPDLKVTESITTTD